MQVCFFIASIPVFCGVEYPAFVSPIKQANPYEWAFAAQEEAHYFLFLIMAGSNKKILSAIDYFVHFFDRPKSCGCPGCRGGKNRRLDGKACLWNIKSQAVL
jgi:hypothetical protein